MGCSAGDSPLENAVNAANEAAFASANCSHQQDIYLWQVLRGLKGKQSADELLTVLHTHVKLQKHSPHVCRSMWLQQGHQSDYAEATVLHWHMPPKIRHAGEIETHLLPP